MKASQKKISSKDAIKTSNKDSHAQIKIGKWTAVSKKTSSAKKSDPICNSSGCT